MWCVTMKIGAGVYFWKWLYHKEILLIFLFLRSSDKSSDQLLEILRVISQMQESSHQENKRFEKL